MKYKIVIIETIEDDDNPNYPVRKYGISYDINGGRKRTSMRLTPDSYQNIQKLIRDEVEFEIPSKYTPLREDFGVIFMDYLLNYFMSVEG